MKSKVYFKTFGCRTNLFDTQTMIAHLKDYEVTLQEEESDVIVINSCTVTNGADIGVRQYISQFKKSTRIKSFLNRLWRSEQRESLLNQQMVDGVFGHSHKSDINSLLAKKDRFLKKGDLKLLIRQ